MAKLFNRRVAALDISTVVGGGDGNTNDSDDIDKIVIDIIQTVAKAFIETGLHRHHSVAIIGSNSPHWVIANLAAINAGLVEKCQL